VNNTNTSEREKKSHARCQHHGIYKKERKKGETRHELYHQNGLLDVCQSREQTSRHHTHRRREAFGAQMLQKYPSTVEARAEKKSKVTSVSLIHDGGFLYKKIIAPLYLPFRL
jgi:hypothetical protein